MKNFKIMWNIVGISLIPTVIIATFITVVTVITTSYIDSLIESVVLFVSTTILFLLISYFYLKKLKMKPTIIK